MARASLAARIEEKPKKMDHRDTEARRTGNQTWSSARARSDQWARNPEPLFASLCLCVSVVQAIFGAIAHASCGRRTQRSSRRQKIEIYREIDLDQLRLTFIRIAWSSSSSHPDLDLRGITYSPGIISMPGAFFIVQ
jgi:hypothetical protein